MYLSLKVWTTGHPLCILLTKPGIDGSVPESKDWTSGHPLCILLSKPGIDMSVPESKSL